MRSTLENILKIVDCQAGSILLYDSRTSELSLAEIIGADGSCRSGDRQGVSSGIAGWVARNRKPLLIEDIEKDGRFTELRNAARAYETNSFVSTPLLDGERLVGVLNVCDKRSGEAFAVDDLHVLRTLADGITESLRSGLSFRELSEKNLTLSEKLEHAARQLVNTNLELAQVQGFHDNVLRSISLGLMTFDRGLRLTFYNVAAEALFRFTTDDIGRKSMLKLGIRPKEGRPWPDIVNASLAKGQPCTVRQASYVSPDGREVVLDVTCAPLDMSTGEIGGTLVVEDIGRTIQIERRLAQAEQLATIGKLAASVAHELNNPLDGVLRFTRMAMKQDVEKPKVLEYLQECRTGLQRMSKIVRSLLDYSRTIGKGLEDLDANELITSAIRSLRSLQMKNNVTVTTNFGENIPRARFANFCEVFSNIIRNAYEAMPLGGELTISTSMDDSTLVVRFTDTGKGISPEIRDKIFEPFFTTRNNAECTGLGLTICSDIVAKHGGSIHVDSAKARGTTFEVRVPL